MQVGGLALSVQSISTSPALTDPFLVDGGETGAIIRAMDWAKTPIGPISGWSPSLRMMVNFLLANRFPLLLWWGPHYISIYNDAYRPVLGTKHPRAMGLPVSECWSEIWHILQPLIDTPFNGGPATWMEDICLEINRHGFVEETHFTVAYSPVPDETAPRGIGGVLATVHEITEKIIGERRVVILRDLGAHAADAKTADEACRVATAVLEHHGKDIPFALLYLVDRDGKRACLAGAAGVAAGEAFSPLAVPLDGDAAGAAWPLAEAIRREETIVVENLGRQFAQVPGSPWSDPPHCALVIPLRARMAHEVAALLVAGVSPRLQLDHLYRSFFDLVAGQVATSIANARAYEEERKRAEALAEIDRAKTAFFSNVSHEFRTPLTLMLGPIEDALNDGAHRLPDPQQKRLDVAHRNSLRLLKLVNSLLDFARIEAGRTDASFEPTDLCELTTALVANFESAVQKAGLALDVQCEPLSRPVFVDRSMWEKIVLNLVSNAFKFTFSGGITVVLKADGDRAQLLVRDTGVGIPPHELPRLFERFYRVAGQRSRSFEGSGIGLALIHELVKLHGGTIDVDSEVGSGTTFTVSVPFGSSHLPRERLQSPHTLSSTALRAQAYVEEALRWLPDAGEDALSDRGEGVEPLLLSSPSDVRVLIADDNADMRGYLKRLLGTRWDVEAVADGRAALEAMRANKPDLVLTDVMMPVMDGFALLREIRADPELQELPVVMLSARAGEEARIEGLHAGANDYLIKPFSARELIARLNTNLELARIRHESRKAIQDEAALLERLNAALRESEQSLEAKVEARTAELVAANDQLRSEAFERRRVEEELRQAQKMEAIGHLTGGVAHDFNNLLTVVIGNIESVQRHLGEQTPARTRRSLDNAMHGARRAVSLTQHLLAFSRRQPLDPKPTDVNVLLKNLAEMLVRTLGERIDVQTIFGTDLFRVHIDQGQLETAILNLAVNARDAMRDGGKLTIETANANLDETHAGSQSARAGQYVVIAVSDTGSGMSKDVLEHAFEPFFTTKPTGHGTGLGLSQVYGFVKQSGGYVKLHSVESQGTTVRIYLPRMLGEAEMIEAGAGTAPDGRKETVLVVEDNAEVREYSCEILRELGYIVIEAEDGPAAIRQIERTDNVDLLFTDVGLPGMTGRELAEHAYRRRPNIRVLYTTGYAREMAAQQARLDGRFQLIAKPFTYVDLAAKVREVLDARLEKT